MPGGASAGAAISTDVPPDVQRLIEDSFAPNFIYPETTDWSFASIEAYYGGNLVCGTVKYQNAQRKYVDARHFWAVVGEHAVSSSAMDQDASEDPTGKAAASMKMLCHTH